VLYCTIRVSYAQRKRLQRTNRPVHSSLFTFSALLGRSSCRSFNKNLSASTCSASASMAACICLVQTSASTAAAWFEPLRSLGKPPTTLIEAPIKAATHTNAGSDRRSFPSRVPRLLANPGNKCVQTDDIYTPCGGVTYICI